MRMALVYDMDACRGPTGVTRHAMAQLRGLAERTDMALTAVSGRIAEPDGLAFWETLAPLPRRELPIRTRDMLRWWRVAPWPPVELWTGPVDWVYCPSEYFVPTRKARRAVTSHDVLQDLSLGGPRRRERLAKAFQGADLILSVSRFNTEKLREAFPDLRDHVAEVPNAAEDLFFEPSTERERSEVRADLGIPEHLPYLLSVANFQPRKNLDRMLRALSRFPEVRDGSLGLVLLGTGSDAAEDALTRVVAELGKKAVVALPGYRQGPRLRGAYAEAAGLVFPSTCESFGIPAVEAMAVGCPVALANSTALPEIGGEAGWYFDPLSEAAITSTVAEMLHRSDERNRRVAIGQSIAAGYRWKTATDRLVEALNKCG